MKRFVCIIYSKSRDRYYFGSSADVENRLIRYNAGATPSTKTGRPWKIVYTKDSDSKTDALKFENYLKRMKSRKLIVSLIDDVSSAG